METLDFHKNAVYYFKQAAEQHKMAHEYHLQNSAHLTHLVYGHLKIASHHAEEATKHYTEQEQR